VRFLFTFFAGKMTTQTTSIRDTARAWFATCRVSSCAAVLPRCHAVLRLIGP